jgi:hypothetical protein
MEKRISLCALFYGDNPSLAHRCLSSIWARLPEGKAHLYDIRLGLNVISESVRSIVDWFTLNTQQYYQVPVIHYDCSTNACKYPLMRRMLLSDPRPPAKFVMWFDDDSYLDGDSAWWNLLLSRAEQSDMLGKVYHQGIRSKQWEWVLRQPWYREERGKPTERRGKRSFVFATGGWWVIRHAVLQQWDWPTPELKHCGGDSMLGELIRHQRLRLENFEQGVRINADEKGRHSKARPRGESWNRVLLGTNGYVRDTDLSHHDFSMTRRVYGCD